MIIPLKELQKEWVITGRIAAPDFLVLAMYVLNKNRTEFFREKDIVLTEEEVQMLTGLLERRIKKEPVAYLTGKKEFFGRTFFVNKATLIPRPGSECLVEDVLSFRENIRKPNYIFDIGTGSGALIVTLASELSNTPTQFIGSDISLDALVIAEKNKEHHHVPVTFLPGSFLEPYQDMSLARSYIYLVANLPYVSGAALKETEPDVHLYEPESALFSEHEGMAHYHELFKEIKALPNTTGLCWIEISPEQTEALTEAIRQTFPETELFIGQDLSQKNRFIRFTF